MTKKNLARKIKPMGYAKWSQGGRERTLIKSHQADNSKPDAKWTIFSFSIYDQLGVKGDGLVKDLLPTIQDAYCIEIDPTVWKNVEEFIMWAKGEN